MPDLERFVLEHTLEPLDGSGHFSGTVLVETVATAVEVDDNISVPKTCSRPFYSRHISLQLPSSGNAAFSSPDARIYLTIKPHGQAAYARVGIKPQPTGVVAKLTDLLPGGVFPATSADLGSGGGGDGLVSVEIPNWPAIYGG